MTTRHDPYIPPLWRRVFSLPKTRPGWWSVGLAAVFALYLFGLVIGVGAMEAENLPGIGPFMFVLTLAAAATGLTAVLRRGERSILLIFPVVIGVSVLFLEISELLGKW